MDRPPPPPRQGSAIDHKTLINNIFEIEKKLSRLDEDHTIDHTIDRNVRRIKDAFEKAGLTYDDPTGEPYDETRTDCEASIAGDSQENLVITEVIKPIIRVNRRGVNHIEQRGVVIVKSQNQQTTDE